MSAYNDSRPRPGKSDQLPFIDFAQYRLNPTLSWRVRFRQRSVSANVIKALRFMAVVPLIQFIFI